jgi:hypothetical protein
MKEESLSWRTELFFTKNWKYFFWGIILFILIVAWKIHLVNGKIENLEGVVAKNNGKVVLVTTDGRAVGVIKSPLQKEYLMRYAVSVFANNFIVSRYDVTNNFKKNSFSNATEVLANSEKLTMAHKEYLNNSNEQALKSFSTYLQWLLTAVNEDKLPEYITLKNYYINSYDYNGSSFWADFNIGVIVQSRTNNIRRDETIRVSANYTFDLGASSDSNPHGVKINEFAINMTTKGK